MRRLPNFLLKLVAALSVLSVAAVAQYHWRFDLRADPITRPLIEGRSLELRNVDLVGAAFQNGEGALSVREKLDGAGFVMAPEGNSQIRRQVESLGAADAYYFREARTLLDRCAPILAVKVRFDDENVLTSAVGGYFHGWCM